MQSAAPLAVVAPSPSTFTPDFTDTVYTPDEAMPTALEGQIGLPTGASYFSWIDQAAYHDIGYISAISTLPIGSTVTTSVELTFTPNDLNVYNITDFSFNPETFWYYELGFPQNYGLTVNYQILGAVDTSTGTAPVLYDYAQTHSQQPCSVVISGSFYTTCFSFPVNIANAKSIVISETATIGSPYFWLFETIIDNVTIHTLSQPVSRIAFTETSNGYQAIFAMNTDGSNQSQLTAGTSNDSFPSWSPDYQRIAFVSDRDLHPEIYVMNADGSNQQRLTNGSINYHPMWSPKGDAIAFVSEDDGNQEIYILRISVSNNGVIVNSRQTLTHGNAAYVANYDPAWSPDGQTIAFVSDRDGNREIYTIPAAGGTASNFTNTPQADYDPMWSPDGKNIAFVTEREGFPEVFTQQYPVPPGAIIVANISQDSLHASYKPIWLSNTQIAFVSERNNSADLYIWKTGSGITRLTTSNATDTSPTSSPDGTKIAFASTRNGSSAIYVIDTSGNNILASAPAGSEVAWSQSTDRHLEITTTLGRYSVQAIPSTGKPRQWSDAELKSVLAAVERVSEAVDVSNFTTANKGPLATVFKRIFGNVIFARDATQQGSCETVAANSVETVTCYGNLAPPPNNGQRLGNLPLTEYVLAHELGHVLDGRSGNLLRNAIATTTTTDTIIDLRGIVMGNFPDPITRKYTNWRRGERGWGSGPGSVYVNPTDDVKGTPSVAVSTDFQQHPAPYSNPNAQVTANFETAADMFLNWAYRTISTQQGFQNKTWKPSDNNGSCYRIPVGAISSPGCPDTDPTYTPGNARFTWMNGQIQQIFQTHPTW